MEDRSCSDSALLGGLVRRLEQEVSWGQRRQITSACRDRPLGQGTDDRANARWLTLKELVDES